MSDYVQNWLQAKQAALQNGLKIVEIGWEQHVIIDKQKNIVYRYPRHQSAADKLADEVSVLKDIHKQEWQLKLPVMLEHNQVFTSYTLIPGEVLTPDQVAKLNQGQLQTIGEQIGAFLVQFHMLDPAIVAQKKTRQTTSLLDYYAKRIKTSTASQYYSKALQTLNALEQSGHQNEDVVVHGDLHGPNVVINSRTKLVEGVIDISEMETGDPHLEFRKIFMTFSASLESAIASYQANGGQQIDRKKVILWAYVNEWANACYFETTPDNITYKRALKHLQLWGQL